VTLKYEPLIDKPKVVLVDIDGTVSQRQARSPYDMTRVLEDLPIQPVVNVVFSLQHAMGIRPVFITARNEVGMADTRRWLRRWVTYDVELYMRADGDEREDHEVKLELFDKHIRHNYNVRLVLDDRQQVVDMWRSLGLVCLQASAGEF